MKREKSDERWKKCIERKSKLIEQLWTNRRRFFAKKFFLGVIVAVMAGKQLYISLFSLLFSLSSLLSVVKLYISRISSNPTYPNYHCFEVRGAFLVTYPTIVITPSFPISWFLVWNHGAELLFAFAYVMLLLFWYIVVLLSIRAYQLPNPILLTLFDWRLDFFLQVSQGKNTDFFFRYRTPVILFFVISTTIFIVLSVLLFTWCRVDPTLRLMLTLYCSLFIASSSNCNWLSRLHRYVLIDNLAAGYLSALFLLTALGFLAIGVQFILHVFR